MKSLAFFKESYFYILAIILLSSCAGKNEKVTSTAISLNLNKIIDTSKGAGGIVLYGLKTAGGFESFGKIIAAGAHDPILPLSNGKWKFFAIAWEGPGNFEGVVRCADGPEVNLNGANLNVSLTLSNANCNNGMWSPVSLNQNISGVYSFADTNIVNCIDISGVSAYGDQSKCSSSTDRSNKGHFGSFKVAFREFMQKEGNYNTFGSIESTCQSISSTTAPDDSMASSSLNIPQGNSAIPLSTSVTGFYGRWACETDNGAGREYFFRNGLNNIISGSKFYTNYSSSTYTTQLFLSVSDNDICSSGTRTAKTLAQEFSGGTGVASRPYVLCNKTQFNQIGGSGFSSIVNKHFRLAADLDFLGTANALTPIGDAFTSLENHGSATDPSHSYAAVFEGANHKISNVYLKVTNNNFLGIFRQMTANAEVKNLTIDRMEINCTDSNSSTPIYCQKIGSIAGAAGGTSSVIKNIFVHSKIDGEDNVGGLIGEVKQDLNFTQVHAYAVINGGVNLGGLIGTISDGSVNITESSVRAYVDSDRSGNVDSCVGGVVGKSSTATTTITKVAARANLSGNKMIGGIIGSFLGPSGSTIEDTYFMGTLRGNNIYDKYADIGGIVGSLGSIPSMHRTIAPAVLIDFKRRDSDLDWSEENGAYAGGLIGNATSGCANVGSNSYFSSSNNTSGAWDGNAAAGCGTYATQANLKLHSIYSSSFGSTYYSNDGTKTWVLASANDTYDYPRLSFELAIENKVPYLKRPCSGLFTTAVGAGTSASPYWVCTITQFEAMSTSSYYILKNDIVYEGSSAKSSPIFSSGVYHLDGDNRGIYGLSFTGNAATTKLSIFDSLNSGSVIKNLKLGGFTVDFAASALTSSPNVSILADSNVGTIDKVESFGHLMKFVDVHITSNSVYLSGIANLNSGTIQNSYSSFLLESKIDNSGATGSFYTSGMIYSNSGTILNSISAFELLYNSVTVGFNSTATHFYSGVTAFNNSAGIINQVDARGYLQIVNTSTAAGGKISGLVYNNNGLITDSVSSLGSNLSYFNGSIAGLAYTNSSGSTVRRSFYKNTYGQNYLSNAMPTDYNGTIITNSGTSTENFCHDSSQTSLSGTLSMANVTTLTGAATAFNTELNTGDIICVGTQCRAIASVDSPTQVTTTASWSSPSGSLYKGAIGPGCVSSYTYSLSSGYFMAPSGICSYAWSIADDIYSSSGYTWIFTDSTSPPFLKDPGVQEKSIFLGTAYF